MNQLKKTLLFAKPLAFTSTASLDECMKRFQAMEVRHERLFQRSITEVTLERMSDTRCEVDIRAKRVGRGWDPTTAHVTGMLDVKSNRIIDFHGRIKLGIFYLLNLVSVCIVILITATSPVFNPIILFLGIAFIAYLSFNISTDRNRLIKAVQTAMATGHDIDH